MPSKRLVTRSIPEGKLMYSPVEGFKTLTQPGTGRQTKPSQVSEGLLAASKQTTSISHASNLNRWSPTARIFGFFFSAFIRLSAKLLDSRIDLQCFETVLNMRMDFSGSPRNISSSKSMGIIMFMGFRGFPFRRTRNVKQVDPSRPVPYRSGLVFERVTAGQARAGCGLQNG